jgi:hypothetical protein
MISNYFQPQNQENSHNATMTQNNHSSNKNKRMNSSYSSSANTSFSSPSGQQNSPRQNQQQNNRQLPLRSKNINVKEKLSTFFSDPANMERMRPLTNKQDLLKCSFCEVNGECEEVYKSHPLKDSLGKVVCPILRDFKCPKCGESGDYAHTNKYCPETQRKHKENKIKRCFQQL